MCRRFETISHVDLVYDNSLVSVKLRIAALPVRVLAIAGQFGANSRSNVAKITIDQAL